MQTLWSRPTMQIQSFVRRRHQAISIKFLIMGCKPQVLWNAQGNVVGDLLHKGHQYSGSKGTRQIEQHGTLPPLAIYVHHNLDLLRQVQRKIESVNVQLFIPNFIIFSDAESSKRGARYRSITHRGCFMQRCRRWNNNDDWIGRFLCLHCLW